MAQQVFSFKVTAPAGTAIAAPVAVDISFPQAIVQEIQLVVPDGHAGLTGIAIQQAHTNVVPRNAGNWIISNDEKIAFPLEDYLDNGSWQVLMYNTDVYDHSWYLRFLCGTIGNGAAPAVALTAPYLPGIPVTGADQVDTGTAAEPAA